MLATLLVSFPRAELGTLWDRLGHTREVKGVRTNGLIIGSNWSCLATGITLIVRERRQIPGHKPRVCRVTRVRRGTLPGNTPRRTSSCSTTVLNVHFFHTHTLNGEVVARQGQITISGTTTPFLRLSDYPSAPQRPSAPLSAPQRHEMTTLRLPTPLPRRWSYNATQTITITTTRQEVAAYVAGTPRRYRRLRRARRALPPWSVHST